MKIAIIGYSGSGKSTLARILAEKYALPCLHLDSVHHLPGWQERPPEESRIILRRFLDDNTSWVIDGNYSKLYYEERLEQADAIVMLIFNRFSCFFRAFRRFLKYRNRSRPDMGQGCNEKFDWEFAWWILKNGRKKQSRVRNRRIQMEYANKITVIKNQRQLDQYIASIK